MTAFCQFSHENEIKKKRAEEKAKFEEKAYLEKEEQIRSSLTYRYRSREINRRVNKKSKEVFE